MHALLMVALVLGAGEIGPNDTEVLATTPAALSKLARAEIKVESNGQATTYAGVPLAAILASRAKPIEGMPGLRDLSDAVILLRAKDGYRVAVSAAAVAMDPKGERYLLADARDGQARAPQLIIPGDPQRVRWIRDVVEVRLVRLDQLLKPEP